MPKLWAASSAPHEGRAGSRWRTRPRRRTCSAILAFSGGDASRTRPSCSSDRRRSGSSSPPKSRCAHFHGTAVARPIPYRRVYGGTVFELVDQAVDFVLGAIDRTVGTRAETVQAPVAYEIPKQVVTEAVVNAVAHRDYTDPESVQVLLFRDRLEVISPGRPPSLSVDELRASHAFAPRQPAHRRTDAPARLRWGDGHRARQHMTPVAARRRVYPEPESRGGGRGSLRRGYGGCATASVRGATLSVRVRRPSRLHPTLPRTLHPRRRPLPRCPRASVYWNCLGTSRS